MSTGEVLLAGRYRLDGLLGTGGMGEVHRAFDTHLRRDVALKLFPTTTDTTTRQRFDNEIHLLARLSHPNLVAVYDAGTSEGLDFVALQLVDGPTLRERIHSEPLTPGELRRLGAHLADALNQVHTHGVVHRDVKPSNILLDQAGTPYLADFGLARLIDSTRLTRRDEMVGTAAYLAPEQVRGTEVGPPADIYAFGLVLLECLTGLREYDGNEIEAAVARLHRSPTIPANLPADLAQLLALMTASEPDLRPTAEQCGQALRSAQIDPAAAVAPTRITLVNRPVDDPAAIATQVTAAIPVRQGPQTVKRLLLAAALGAFAVTGVAWATLGNPPPATSEPSAPAASEVAPAEQPQQVVITQTTTVIVPVPATQTTTTPPPVQRANDETGPANSGPGPGQGAAGSGNSGPGGNGNSPDKSADKSADKSEDKSKGKKPDRPGADD